MTASQGAAAVTEPTTEPRLVSPLVQQLLLLAVTAGLAIAVVVLLVQVHELRQDVSDISHGSGSPVLDVQLGSDAADLCRMIGAVAAEQGIKPAEVFSSGEGASGQVWSDCAYAAIAGGGAGDRAAQEPKP